MMILNYKQKKLSRNNPISDIPDRMSGSKFYFVPNNMKTAVRSVIHVKSRRK
jgi:hypothetical protein